jgi:hypothetical protein
MRHKAEEIVAKLRQVEVLSGQGQSVAEAIRSIGVTEVTWSSSVVLTGGSNPSIPHVRRSASLTLEASLDPCKLSEDLRSKKLFPEVSMHG